MIVKKNLSVKAIFEFAGHHLYWLLAWMSAVAALYHFTHWKFLAIPWLPLSLIGTAVAFYVGFKNNQSYNRLLEARQIWGGFVNDSRKFATMLKNFRANETDTDVDKDIRRKIIFRHIAFLYQFRKQMLEPSLWEHVSQPGRIGYYNRKRRARNFGYYQKELEEVESARYLSEKERTSLQHATNKAAQLLDMQTAALQKLYLNNAINSFQHMQLQAIINSINDEQGRAERIKRFPFPRKYASFSFVFVCIFIFLLPFGMVGEFAKLGASFVWLIIPVGVIVGWIYVVMEMIGDYSENPFQGLHNDIPMLSLNRTVEIDMLEMFGENNIPEPIQPKKGILL